MDPAPPRYIVDVNSNMMYIAKIAGNVEMYLDETTVYQLNTMEGTLQTLESIDTKNNRCMIARDIALPMRKSLTEIDCSVADASILALISRQLVPELKTLTLRDIDDGRSSVAFAQALKYCTKLTQISLHVDSFSARVANCLADAFRIPRLSCFSWDIAVVNHGGAHTRNGDAAIFVSDILAAVADSTNRVETLRVECLGDLSPLTAGLARVGDHIKTFSAVGKSFWKDETSVREFFSTMKDVGGLDIADALIPPTLLADIVGTRVHRLRLECRHLGAEDVSQLAEKLKHVEQLCKLDVCGWPRACPEGLVKILTEPKTRRNVGTLALRHMKLGDEVWEQLKKFHLRMLVLEHIDMDDDSFLRHVPPILSARASYDWPMDELHLGGNSLSAQAIISVLPLLPGLCVLDLSNRKVDLGAPGRQEDDDGDEGLLKICRHLNVLPKLRTLNVSHRNLVGFFQSVNCFMLLSTLAQTAPKLENLDASGGVLWYPLQTLVAFRVCKLKTFTVTDLPPFLKHRLDEFPFVKCVDEIPALDSPPPRSPSAASSVHERSGSDVSSPDKA